MKKRLRKKKHRGEYTEWGRKIVIVRNRKDEFDGFFDAFIVEAIEANGCFCGGGGSEDNLEVIVELGAHAQDADAKVLRIGAWLDARPDVLKWKCGDKIDLWHGDFEKADS
jgi:uncharacterized protein YggL (DUF469 family)